jgi:hypothetical protein
MRGRILGILLLLAVSVTLVAAEVRCEEDGGAIHRFNIGLSYAASIGYNVLEREDSLPVFLSFPVSPIIYAGWRVDHTRWSYDLGLAGSGPEYWTEEHGLKSHGVPVILRTRLAGPMPWNGVWIGMELDLALVLGGFFWTGLRVGISWRPLGWVELSIDPLGVRFVRGSTACALSSSDDCQTDSQLGWWPSVGLSFSCPRDE